MVSVMLGPTEYERGFLNGFKAGWEDANRHAWSWFETQIYGPHRLQMTDRTDTLPVVAPLAGTPSAADPVNDHKSPC